MTRKQRPDESGSDVNLAPFMNMVVILIPLLLLSVVFVQVGVINTSTDLTTPEPTSEHNDSVQISLALGRSGAHINVDGHTLSPIERCPESGPTVCLEETDRPIGDLFAEIRQAAAQDDQQRIDDLVDEAMAAYDFRGIYNVLSKVKQKHPDETRIVVTADSDVPYALLVRAMDTSRYRLEKESYADDTAFANASRKRGERLFSDPVMAIAQ